MVAEEDRVALTDDAPSPEAHSVALEKPARFAFDSDQIATIKRTVARECDDNEFQMFMEVVGRHRLDPFIGEVYAAKMPARDGAKGQVAIIVSRDGLLAIANREGGFNGLDGDVVREKDHFKSTFTNGQRNVEHVAEGGPEVRGAIVGSWAMVHREGRKPTYFFAPMGDYKTGNKTWSKYPSAMILKVAESMALRKAFSISGVVGEGEIDRQLEVGVTVGAPEVVIDFGPDPLFAIYLERLFAEANRVRPDSFRPQKQAFALAGATDATRAKIAHDLEAFVLSNGGAVPTPEEVQAILDEKVAGEAEEQAPEGDPGEATPEEIAEAEVVNGGKA